MKFNICASPVFFSTLLWILLASFLALLSPSCGRPNVKLSLHDREKHYRTLYSATERNIASWVNAWDGHSWIAGLSKEITEKPDRNVLKSLLIDHVSNHFSGILFADEMQLFRDNLATGLNLQLSFSPLRAAKNVGVEAGDSTQWFAKIEMPSSSPLWQPILQFALPPLPLSEKIRTILALTQFQALRSMNELEWIEPNLGSETKQSCVPAGNDSSRPLEWYDANGSCIDPEKNRIRKVFSRINWHLAQDAYDKLLPANPSLRKKEIPVAVIDTGIDYAHSKLKDHLFKNPNGEEFNGIDDDGNGVIDDVYGFDATIPTGTIDTSYQAPGAADIGGPGRACPDQAGTPGGGSCGHGTHVGGVVAAGQGGLHALGLCDACKLYSIRAAKKCVYPETTTTGTCIPPNPNGTPPQEGSYIANGKIFDWDQIVGLNYLLNFTSPNSDRLNIFIVNLSLGKYIYNRAMASSLSKLQENGVLVVAAAGNDNTETPMFPAAYSSTLSVCATSENAGTVVLDRPSYGERGEYAKADFSNFGDWIDVCAPGVDIQSTLPGENIDAWSGTSQASPLVAGAAGYLWSVLYELGEDSRSVRARIERFAQPSKLYDSTSNPFNIHYGDSIAGVPNYLLGTGLLDVEASLKGEPGGAQASYVDIARATGADSQLSSGCVVSTIGATRGSTMGLNQKARWNFVSAMTTLPCVMMQFLALLYFHRRKGCVLKFLNQKRGRFKLKQQKSRKN